MTTLWYLLLGLLNAFYFALAGTDYGVGMLLPTVRTGRRDALNALGPFFLANQVWVVAAVGVLFGAFPGLEGELFSALYPLVFAVALALAAVMAAVLLRSRQLGAAEDRPVGLDRVIVAASVVIVMGWGMVLGNLLIGRPLAADGSVAGPGGMFGWFPLLAGATLTALCAYNGAVFLAWRGGDRAGATGRAKELWPVATAAVIFTTVAGLFADGIRDNAGPKAPIAVAGLIGMVGLLAVSRLVVYRPLASWLLSAVAAALPVLIVGLLLYPNVLVSTVDPAASLTVTDGVAGGHTLRLLNSVALPWLVVVLLVQAASWMIFGRARPGPDRAQAVRYW